MNENGRLLTISMMRFYWVDDFEKLDCLRKHRRDAVTKTEILKVKSDLQVKSRKSITNTHCF